jgi:hypothetical protein
MDQHWNVVTPNCAAEAFFGWLLSDPVNRRTGQRDEP